MSDVQIMQFHIPAPTAKRGIDSTIETSWPNGSGSPLISSLLGSIKMPFKMIGASQEKTGLNHGQQRTYMKALRKAVRFVD